MLNYFLLLNILMFIYFFLIRQKFDLFFLLYISSLIYFSPGFFEVVWYKDSLLDIKIKIANKTYIIFLIVQFSFLFFSIFNDRLKTHKVKFIKVKEYKPDNVIFWIVVMNTVFLLLSLYSINFNIFASRKILMESYSFFYTIWTYSSIITFVLGWIYRKKYKGLFLLSLFSIGFIFFLGDRTSIMLSIIAIFLFEFWDKNIIDLIFKHKLKLLIAVFFAVFGFVSKSIYAYIRVGEYQLAIKYLLKIENYKNSFIESEPFITQMILNHLISNNININSNYMEDLKYQFLLIPSKFKEYPSFSEIIQRDVFPNVEYGLAGNIWAEVFNAGSYSLLIFFLILLNFLVLFMNKVYKNVDPLFKGVILVLGTLTCFYIHRNFLESYLTMIRLSILFVAFSLIISLVFVMFFKNKKGQNRL